MSSGDLGSDLGSDLCWHHDRTILVCISRKANLRDALSARKFGSTSGSSQEEREICHEGSLPKLRIKLNKKHKLDNIG